MTPSCSQAYLLRPTEHMFAHPLVPGRIRDCPARWEGQGSQDDFPSCWCCSAECTSDILPDMSRVLVTGGAGTIGSAVVRRLLADPAYEVRVSDQRPAPQWMREGCEVHTGDLRELEQARRATEGCAQVIHLAAIVGGIANFHRLPHTLTEVNNALYNAVVRAAIEAEVERFVYVSSSMVFERATSSPRPRRTCPTAPCRSRRTASPSSRARCTAGRRTRSTGSRTRSAAPSTRTAPARCPTPSPASPTPCPT